MVSAARETIGGSTYYIFTIFGSARPCVNTNNMNQISLPVGTKLAARDSTTGRTNSGYMLFYKKKAPGSASWVDLYPNLADKYGFVDLGLNVGSMPSTRPIR